MSEQPHRRSNLGEWRKLAATMTPQERQSAEDFMFGWMLAGLSRDELDALFRDVQGSALLQKPALHVSEGATHPPNL